MLPCAYAVPVGCVMCHIAEHDVLDEILLHVADPPIAASAAPVAGTA